MRKNIAAVIEAFKKGESHAEKTCRTDGSSVWSYALEIAKKLDDGSVVVLPESRSPSRTTTSQIRALRVSFHEPTPCACGSSAPFEERGRGWPECPACGMV